MNSDCPTCPNLMPFEQKDAKLQREAIKRAVTYYTTLGYSGNVIIEKLVNGSYSYRTPEDPDKGREYAQTIFVN